MFDCAHIPQKEVMKQMADAAVLTLVSGYICFRSSQERLTIAGKSNQSSHHRPALEIARDSIRALRASTATPQVTNAVMRIDWTNWIAPCISGVMTLHSCLLQQAIQWPSHMVLYWFDHNDEQGLQLQCTRIATGPMIITSDRQFVDLTQ